MANNAKTAFNVIAGIAVSIGIICGVIAGFFMDGNDKNRKLILQVVMYAFIIALLSGVLSFASGAFTI